MRKVGIWLDKEKAHIITLENELSKFETVFSEVENFRPHGGSGTRFKGGPQDVVQDSKFLEREKHQLKNYFKEIAGKIQKADALLIVGPAGTNEKFNLELKKKYKALSEKVREVRKADAMTDNQIKALVKDFYS